MSRWAQKKKAPADDWGLVERNETCMSILPHARAQGRFFADSSLSVALSGWLEFDAVLKAPSCSDCNMRSELRYCAGNDAVAFQCPRCLAQVQRRWIPHALLRGLEFRDLPAWEKRT
jgi:hypothetical protein